MLNFEKSAAHTLREGSRSSLSRRQQGPVVLTYGLFVIFLFLILGLTTTTLHYSTTTSNRGLADTIFTPSAVTPAVVSAVLTASPASGMVGATITFDGVNFTASSSVTVSWSGGTVCLATTNSKGSFSCSFAITATTAGSHTFTATDSANISAVVVFTVIPQLTVVPSSGPAGTPVTFSWTGFNPSNNCGGFGGYCATTTITWMAGSLTVCSVNNDGLGSGGCKFMIPPGTSVTSTGYLFTAADNANPPDVAHATFNVTYTPKLTVSPTEADVGTAIVFSGAGYAASSQITLTWSQGTVCLATTNLAGSFTCTFTIPVTGAGTHTFTGTDGNSGSATATFTVTPNLVVSPGSGPVGTQITFSWTGFNPSNGCGYYGGYCATTSVTWLAGSTNACSQTDDNYGSASCTYVIPLGTSIVPGGYLFTAADSANPPNVAHATFNVTYPPQLSASPISGAVGTTITFSGNNYTTNSPVSVSWSSLGTTACTATTNSVGSFTCNYFFPAATAGNHTFSSRDVSGESATTIFTVTPQLALSQTSGPTGTTFTFSSTGFSGGSSITISWTGGLACSGTTNTAGTFVCSFSIPTAAVGGHLFTASDGSSNSATATFTITPQIQSSLSTATKGQVTSFSGTGFAAGSTVTISWSGGTACSGATSGVGSFSCMFVIPAATQGGHNFTGADSSNHSAVTTLTIMPELEISPTFGSAGSTIAYVATGFGPSSSITISWGGGTACSGTTSSNGTFTCTFIMPTATPVNSYQFTATDSFTNEGVSTFTIPSGGGSTSSCPSGPYAINFTETGLPSSMLPWSVSVQGCPRASTDETIVFQVGNGTGYIYAVAPVSGYNATRYTGIFNVTGTGLNFIINWTLFKGQKGDTGSQGPQGPTGATGATGAQGPQGNTGSAGQPGSTGSAGSQGAPGQQGPAGPQGPSSALTSYIAIAVAGLAVGISGSAILSLRRKRMANVGKP
jgi:hypothetical protein